MTCPDAGSTASSWPGSSIRRWLLSAGYSPTGTLTPPNRMHPVQIALGAMLVSPFCIDVSAFLPSRSRAQVSLGLLRRRAVVLRGARRYCAMRSVVKANVRVLAPPSVEGSSRAALQTCRPSVVPNRHVGLRPPGRPARFACGWFRREGLGRAPCNSSRSEGCSIPR